MWSDIKANHNKFYIAQGIEKNGKFYLWTRYGRVGLDGVGNNDNVDSKSALESKYYKKYYEKTKKGYTEVKMAVSKTEGSKIEKVTKEDKKEEKIPESKLDKPV